MVGLAPLRRCGLLVDSRVGVRGWGWAHRRIAPVGLPSSSRIGSVMGRLQPVARGTTIRRLINTLAHGAHIGVGVIDKARVVLAVGKRLVVVWVRGDVDMRRGRPGGEDRQHRRHEQGYRSQQDDVSHRSSPPFLRNSCTILLYGGWRITRMQYLLLSFVNRALRSSESNFRELRQRELRRIPLLR